MIKGVPRSRLGVALLLPSPASIEVDALRRAVGVADTTRIAPHLTLVPPVNVREVDIGGALDVLRAAAAAHRPIRLELGPVTSFAPISPTLHLEVGGDLDAVRSLRDAVFTSPLERPLTHAFVPHVTLIEESDRIDDAVSALRDYRCEVIVEQVHLLEEVRREDDGQRMWRPIADARLGGRPAVIGRGGLELELSTSQLLPPDAMAWKEASWRDLDVERYGRPMPAGVPIAIVARRDGRIVATADGEAAPTGEAYLAGLIVSADLRNEGIGAHVVAAFASEAAEAGSTFLALRTEAGGRSQPFYERLGFRVGYVLPEWRNGRDFVQMRKDL
jgi:2'-5' RNA ligase